MPAAFANRQAYIHNNTWTLDRLERKNSVFEEAKSQRNAVIKERLTV